MNHEGLTPNLYLLLTFSMKIPHAGPFKKGRIIDLLYEAARRLDMLDEGTGKTHTFGLGTAPPLKPLHFNLLTAKFPPRKTKVAFNPSIFHICY